MISYLIRIVLELLWWKYQLVGTFETEVVVVHEYNSDKKFSVFIHCFESRWGTRYTRVKIQKAPTFFGSVKYQLKKKVKRGKLYQTEIYPWLHGRAHDKIPSYQKVKGGKWDFLKKLKGETSIVLNDDEK